MTADELGRFMVINQFKIDRIALVVAAIVIAAWTVLFSIDLPFLVSAIIVTILGSLSVVLLAYCALSLYGHRSRRILSRQLQREREEAEHGR